MPDTAAKALKGANALGSIAPATHRQRARNPADLSATSRLVLVTCADMGRLDVVLRPAIARLERSSRILFVEPVGTARLPAGGGERLPASTFESMTASGDLLLAWQQGGRRYGYDIGLLVALDAGHTVIVPAPAGFDLEVQARDLWPRQTIIHVEPGTASLRAALIRSPCDVRLRDVGDPRSVIVALSQALQDLIPPASIAPRLAERSPRPPQERTPHAAPRPRLTGRPQSSPRELSSRPPAAPLQARAPTSVS